MHRVPQGKEGRRRRRGGEKHGWYAVHTIQTTCSHFNTHAGPALLSCRNAIVTSISSDKIIFRHVRKSHPPSYLQYYRIAKEIEVWGQALFSNICPRGYAAVSCMIDPKACTSITCDVAADEWFPGLAAKTKSRRSRWKCRSDNGRSQTHRLEEDKLFPGRSARKRETRLDAQCRPWSQLPTTIPAGSPKEKEIDLDLTRFIFSFLEEHEIIATSNAT